MRRMSRFIVVPFLMVAALGAIRPASVIAGPLPDAFSLGRCVPADAWMYVHAVTNPERAWIDAKWGEVFAELKKSGIDRDLMTLIMSAMGDAERASAQAGIDKVMALIQGVSWSDLADKEFLFAERPSGSMLGFDYIVIVQGKPGSAEKNIVGLNSMLKEIAAVTEAAVNQSKLHDADVWELSHPILTKIGLSVALFRHQDTIGLLTGRSTLEQVVGMLAGKSDAKSLINTPRFQEALALVERPSDSIAFFDMKTFVGSLRNMFQNIAQKAIQEKKAAQEKVAEGKAEGGPDADDIEGMKVITKVLDRVDVFDYSVCTVATKGMREMRWDAMKIQAGKEGTPLAKAILNRKSFEKFDQFIPADAIGFSLSGMIDFEILYDMVLDFIEKDIPDGAQAIAKWKGLLAQGGFDPKADLFAWWSGEMISVTLPPAVVTPMGGSDSVSMVRVKDSALAKAKLDSFIQFVKTKLQGEGQSLMISPAKVDVEGFREITHPSIAMFLKPVIGVHGDWLIISTSSGSLQKCLDVASGKSPSVVKNARFAEEGLVPKGPVRSATFEDTSKSIQEIAAALGMAGMFGGMAVAGMPETNAEEKKAKQAMQSLLGMLMKLGPVLQKVDFYSSASSIGTYDGKLTMKTESVTTYKKSKEEAKSAKAPGK